jgi:hypothetical protein
MVGLLHDRKFRHGSSRALQNFSPNEIGADKIRHQPLAKASGMKSFRTLFRANDKLTVARYNFRRPKVGA